MNWPRIILDGLSMSLLFNAVAGLGFLLVTLKGIDVSTLTEDELSALYRKA